MKAQVAPILLFSASIHCLGFNFAYESLQLTNDHILDFTAIQFGNASSAPKTYQGPRCKYQPGDPSWPSTSEWASLNASLNGHLLKPEPPGSACYPGPKYDADTCAFLVGPARATRFFLDDPLTSLVTWGEGATCLPMLNTTGRTCAQGGFPVYVVNASSVRDIQTAVNFARNRDIRLVIKNTGHDFIAKSTGRGSLSIWTHFLKGMEFLANYSTGEYVGAAARVSAGIEAWEAYNAMAIAGNFTVVVPLDPSVGYGGGWTLGGGHGPLASLYGLGADQVLSMNIVTAEGRFVTADLNQNRDLFFALRGGGGGTFGIVTSMMVKAWPKRTDISGVTYYFTTGPGQSTMSDSRGYPAVPPIHIPDPEVFWRAYRIYLTFADEIVNAGGFGFGDVTPQGPAGTTTYLFASTITIPGMSASSTKKFLDPLFSSYRAAGINLSTPDPATVLYAQRGAGVTPNSFPGASSDRLLITRLLPRRLWANNASEQLAAVAEVNRASAELGYRVTTRAYAPTAAAAGYPGDGAVNPAMRDMVVHCVTVKREAVDVLAPRELLVEHARLSARVDELRRLTPGGGAYFNEADRLEPGFQQSFWGKHYDRLLAVKRAVDPWGLFWVPTGVGSEDWEVVKAEGEMPTQDGPLCRIGGV
ncbi:hypothetical protein B0H67DRAFT_487356 [Lasiosphaeris hirsuta]|uniref:FAD-binding PCMH-type domain-containing protein n=1 Tax=Lasiosphaeris hirsuta TaxID=260670 RepID=A0AA40AI54_9PEZI|nr:hypothetical protein B0H67DRAFT_487356 [Lasiosphaeris hirsuta]